MKCVLWDEVNGLYLKEDMNRLLELDEDEPENDAWEWGFLADAQIMSEAKAMMLKKISEADYSAHIMPYEEACLQEFRVITDLARQHLGSDKTLLLFQVLMIEEVMNS
jgi:hypothetical protein